MKRLSMMMLLLVILVSGSLAYDILIQPDQAIVARNAGQQFTAQVFNNEYVPVAVNQLNWRVEPADMGTISDDGFLIAGEKPGRGKVIVSTRISGVIYTASADVQIGTPPEDEITIKIQPDSVLLNPGDTVNFKAFAFSSEGVSLRYSDVRWTVQPGKLGDFAENGVFTAQQTGRGIVRAFVEIDNKIYVGQTRLLVTLEPTCSLSGMVEDDAGHAIAGAVVSAANVNTRTVRTVRADSLGMYTFKRLIPGTFVIKAQARGYLPEFYENTDEMVSATPLTLTENDSLSSINFSLEKGAVLSGTITDESGNVLENAHVIAFRPLDKQRKIHALSDENGDYTVEGLPAGSYYVLAQAKGYQTEFYQDAENVDQAELIQINADDISGLNFSLATGSALAGIITDELSGEPLIGAGVVLMRNRPQKGKIPSNAIKTTTDENGEFLVSASAGSYFVYVMASGYQGEWYDNAARADDAQTIQISTEGHTMLNVALAPMASISGSVTNAQTGEPVIGALVKAFPENKGNKKPYRAISDSSGTYTIRGVAAGEYLISAVAADMLHEFWPEADSLADADKVVIEPSANVANIDFTLNPGARISGMVTDAEIGAALEAIVTVRNVDSRLQKSAKTNEDGGYELTGLPNGEYIVAAAAPGYQHIFYDAAATRDGADIITISDFADVVNVDMALTVKTVDPTGISGIVVDDSTGLPIEGALVAVMPLDFSRPKKAVTDKDGAYEILGLQPGEYLLTCRAQGYIAEFFNDQQFWYDADRLLVEKDVILNADFALAPQLQGAYTVAGRVVNEKGDPVEGALISLNDAGLTAAYTTDEDGSFLLADVPAGDYQVSVSAAGVQVDDAAVQVNGGENVYDMTIIAHSSATSTQSMQAIPHTFALGQNYPNPFNPTTQIQFQVPADATVELTIFNILGKKVRVLADQSFQAGSHSVNWDGRDDAGVQLSSGVYFYQLTARSKENSFSDLKRMIMLK